MITLATKRRIHRFGYCLSIAIATLVIVAPATTAVASALDEATLAYQAEKALANVLDAQLELQEWYLEQLLVLRNDGDASWIEVARQQTLVDTLRSQRDVTQRLVSYLESLQHRVRLSHQQFGTTGLAESTDLPVIKLSFPGSLRLAGWLEWDQASPAIRASYLEELRATTHGPADSQKQVETAAAEVADGQNLVHQLEQVSGSQKATNDLARAKLELLLSKAELELARLTQRRQQAQSASLQGLIPGENDVATVDVAATTQSSQLARLAAAETNYISHQSDAALRTATLRTAAQEAGNLGALRAAEISVRQLERRVEDVTQLQTAGLATKRDVQEAVAELAAARAFVKRLESERSSLVDSYELLRELAVRDDFPAEHSRVEPDSPVTSSGSQAEQRELATLALASFSNAAVVRHVVDLKRKSSEAEASYGALLAQLNMLKELESRLARAEERLANKRAEASPRISRDDLVAALAKGRRRELENVRLQVELRTAQLQSTAERLAVVRLETDRFAKQMAHAMNDHSHDESSVLADSTDGETIPVVRYDLARVWRQRCSYIELRDTIPNVNLLALTPSEFGLAKSASALQLTLSPAFRKFSRLAESPSVHDRLYNRLRLRIHGLELADCLRFPEELRHQYRYDFAYSPRRFASPLLSYYDEYDAFGSRRFKCDDALERFDRRRPMTYLPGAPKRLPGTPRYLPGTPRRYE